MASPGTAYRVFLVGSIRTNIAASFISICIRPGDIRAWKTRFSTRAKSEKQTGRAELG